MEEQEPNLRKEDARDFGLKANKPDEDTSDSPWGRGRPGWQLNARHGAELSAVCIHGGGLDSCSRITRTSRPVAGARSRVREALDANGMLRFTARRCRSRSATSRRSRK
jgi:hypothetical protein